MPTIAAIRYTERVHFKCSLNNNCWVSVRSFGQLVVP